MPPDAGTLSLRECAERLGVHYMTAYRYVRTGMLAAVKQGTEWRVAVEDLKSFGSGPTGPTSPVARGDAPWARRLRARMVAGDERGSWLVIESAMASGLSPERIYLEVLGPALREIGEAWHRGSGTIAEEHRASAVAHRIVGRMGARFAARGRPRGRVVAGTPPGERHRIPVAMLADMVRAAGFEVIDLGSDLPTEAFVEAVQQAEAITAAVSVITSAALPAAGEVVAAIHTSTGTPVLVGGPAVRDARHAAEIGADGFAGDGSGAVTWINSLLA